MQRPWAHPQSLDTLKNVIVHADVRDALCVVPDESIHLTFTSPPYYNARDYTLYESYEAYLQFLTDIFREVYRITKEGRFFVLNTSPVIIPRMSRAHSSKDAPSFLSYPVTRQMAMWSFRYHSSQGVIGTPGSGVPNTVMSGGFLQHPLKPLG